MLLLFVMTTLLIAAATSLAVGPWLANRAPASAARRTGDVVAID